MKRQIQCTSWFIQESREARQTKTYQTESTVSWYMEIRNKTSIIMSKYFHERCAMPLTNLLMLKLHDKLQKLSQNTDILFRRYDHDIMQLKKWFRYKLQSRIRNVNPNKLNNNNNNSQTQNACSHSVMRFTNGEFLKRSFGHRGRNWDWATSDANEYSLILKVSVGPCGVLATFK